MAAITDYSTLKTGISDYMARGTDLDSFLDDFIDRSEAHFNRKLRMTQMEEETTLTIDSDGNSTLPADFLVTRSARWVGSPNRELRPISMGGENRLSPNDTSSTPYYFSISGTTFRVTPINAGTVTLTYFEKVPALSDSTTTNWLLDLSPDLYFYRCLAEANAFIREFTASTGFAQHAENIMEELTGMDNLARYSNAEIVYDGVVDHS